MIGGSSVDQAKWTADAVQNGLPGEIILAFTILIWGIFSLILLGNPRNKLNIWCFASGMTFSIGALKEYLFYTLSPILVANGIWTISFAETLYSVLSAVFYYFSMPPVLIFSFIFHHWDRWRKRGFRMLCLSAYVPAVILAIVFPCTRTLHYQHVQVFCLTVAGYNWCMGLAGTAIMLHALWEERLSTYYQQRRLAAVSVLVPLWFWLVSAFPYHALGIPNLSKIWQFNLLVVLFILFYCLYHAFRDGIWGVRFHKEVYDWSSGGKALQRNAYYVGHALKNDLTKIEWCTELLSKRGMKDRELDIIRSSVAHLEDFISRTRLYSQQITLTEAPCNIEELFQKVIAGLPQMEERHISVLVRACDSEPLLCDRAHLEEVLYNLVTNAADAMPDGGEVELSYRNQASKGKAVISVTDHGCGIQEDRIRLLFEPYFTTKRNHQNMGLGLYYCWNVMTAHKGSIRVDSKVDCGSTFFLWFPVRRQKHGRG